VGSTIRPGRRLDHAHARTGRAETHAWSLCARTYGCAASTGGAGGASRTRGSRHMVSEGGKVVFPHTHRLGVWGDEGTRHTIILV
jgi:hypothetical protein